MFPAPFKVVLDANVLYPFTLRDTLLRAAAAGLYQAYWSERILDEATGNLIAAGRMTREQAARRARTKKSSPRSRSWCPISAPRCGSARRSARAPSGPHDLAGAWRVVCCADVDHDCRVRRPGAQRVGAGAALMRILITGSAGHLGEALARTLQNTSHEVIGLDILASRFTNQVGSIADRSVVKRCIEGVDAVLHTATLHKPHVATHGRQDFVDTNVTGTLNLLEEAAQARVRAFVFTSTTSAFGGALTPAAGAPAAWITEDVTPVPKNIYGATKTAAEDLCELFHRDHGLACVVLRTSRFFPEEDDLLETRQAYDDGNAKANEYLYRRVDIEDAASAHLLAIEKAPAIGFGKYIISATTPFSPADLADLRADAPRVVARLFPAYEAEYARRGWKMFPSIDRVYVNERARKDLGWRPRYDFGHVLDLLRAGEDPRSPLARAVGSKGYHPRASGLA
jgi:UDP-glucose 4-epimerase